MSATAEPTSLANSSAHVALPARLIGADEQVILALKPGGFFILLTSLPFVAGMILLAVAAHWLTVVSVFSLPDKSVTALAGLACIIRVLVAFMQWLGRIYVLTDRRVLRVKGVLRVDVFQCNLTRIQNTSLSLTLTERLLGLGTVFFATAGTGGSEAAWLMITRPAEVHEIVAEYVRRAQRHGEKPGI